MRKFKAKPIRMARQGNHTEEDLSEENPGEENL
jgi:hypothetical protein